MNLEELNMMKQDLERRGLEAEQMDQDARPPITPTQVSKCTKKYLVTEAPLPEWTLTMMERCIRIILRHFLVLMSQRNTSPSCHLRRLFWEQQFRSSSDM